MTSEITSSEQVLEQLRTQLADGSLVTERGVVKEYSADQADTATVGTALALVKAHSVEDVQATMRIAYEYQVPVVVQGARTGIAGGANAIDGCILLNLMELNQLVDVSTENFTATVQAGMINQDFKDALVAYGMSYPPDPGSVATSTIGGNIATNAGGMCCVKYGVTSDYVRELRVVLADGTVSTVGHKTVKGVAGYQFEQLFCGSEGTLGVIVEATLTTVPLLSTPLTMVAQFPSVVDAAGAVSEIMATAQIPSMLELLDIPTTEMLAELARAENMEVPGLDEVEGSMLIVQSDTAQAATDLEDYERIARAHNATSVRRAETPEEGDKLVEARRMVYPAYVHYCETHHMSNVLEDVCIPRSELPGYVADLEELKERLGVTIAMVAHAGDGNTHPAVFYPTGDSSVMERVEEAVDEIIALGLKHGGTISGEHGIGELKAPFMPQELDQGSQRMHVAVKDALDPRNIFNPGRMLSALGR